MLNFNDWRSLSRGVAVERTRCRQGDPIESLRLRFSSGMFVVPTCPNIHGSIDGTIAPAV